MDNLVQFTKSRLPVDDNFEKGWIGACKVIDHDFTAAGFQSYAEQFKQEFKPILELISVGQYEMPNISADDPSELHQEWRGAIERTKQKFKEHIGKLISDRYVRELEIFVERNIPIDS